MIEANYCSGPELNEMRQTAVELHGRHAFIPAYEHFMFIANATAMMVQVSEDPSSISEHIEQATHMADEAYDQLVGFYIEAGVTEAATMSRTQLLELAKAEKNAFLEYCKDNETRLDDYKREFTERAIEASRFYGLPLTEAQIKERMDTLTLGFGHLTEDDDPNGLYNGGLVHYARVDAFLEPEDEKLIAFHEMAHALSGQRVVNPSKIAITARRRVGLSMVHGNGKIANEPLADIVAASFYTGVHIDYAATGVDSDNQWYIIDALANVDADSYSALKVIFTNGFRHVDIKTISAANFKSDFDTHEQDQLAGTHALKELQRAIKVAGGMHRVRQLKLLERSIYAKQTDIEDIRNRYEDIKKYEQMSSPALRATNARKVQANTNRVARGVAAAREHTAWHK